MSDLISKKELYRKLGEAYNHCLITWGANEIIKDIIGECDSVENKGDLISRQVAIVQLSHNKNGNDDCDVIIQKDIETIKQLPSVENKGEWILQPSNKEQGERDFIWWKCSKCGQVIYSETEKDREEFHAFCGRCGADMRGET